ncbi:hypothetical protein CAGA_19400 [Caproiciproducens galactitolivorans]|uniref:Uncharacterized protein n=1 Tax=Caproiciproducens galactitolivorans TaxID=642589 RepID=A0A4Z0XX26_9FIRM|nr:hypothetical protein CAGA_19400 [Caproiciproducens galactitolivorans]
MRFYCYFNVNVGIEHKKEIPIIFFIRYRFAPLCKGVFRWNRQRQMCKCFIPCRSLPMFNFRCYIHDITAFKRRCFFSELLIPATPFNTEQCLPAAMMNMPIVTATRLKSNIKSDEIWRKIRYVFEFLSFHDNGSRSLFLAFERCAFFWKKITTFPF